MLNNRLCRRNCLPPLLCEDQNNYNFACLIPLFPKHNENAPRKFKVSNDILNFSTQKLENIWIKAVLAVSLWPSESYAIMTGAKDWIPCPWGMHWSHWRGMAMSLLAVTGGKAGSPGSGIWGCRKCYLTLLLATQPCSWEWSSSLPNQCKRNIAFMDKILNRQN